jgi:hypothetical protein
MGRGRQKAKQTKIARKLKYLTTDTDYDELAKELSGQEVSDEQETSAVADEFGPIESVSSHEGSESSVPGVDDDLDDYAKWAAQAAAKATASEIPAAPVARRRHIPIPVPSALKPKLEKIKSHSTVSDTGDASETAGNKAPAAPHAGDGKVEGSGSRAAAKKKPAVKKAAAKKPAAKTKTTRSAKTPASKKTTPSKKNAA